MPSKHAVIISILYFLETACVTQRQEQLLSQRQHQHLPFMLHARTRLHEAAEIGRGAATQRIRV